MLVGYGPSGTAHDFFVFDASNLVWNGSAFVAWLDANYVTYRIAATETGTTGRFTATEPSGAHTYELRIRAGTLTGSTVVDRDYVRIASAVGSGARTVNITVNDGTNPVNLANVRLTKGAESYTAQTNASGLAVFNVDDGTWTVSISKAGFQFSGASLVVDGTENVTYSMTLLLTPAADPAKTTAFLTVFDPAGNLEVGTPMTATVLALPSGNMGASYDATALTVNSNAQGLVQFQNLFKGLSYYIQRGATGKRHLVTIPTTAGATYELPSIIGKP